MPPSKCPTRAASPTTAMPATTTEVPGGTAHWIFAGGTNYKDQGGDVAITISQADQSITVDTPPPGNATFGDSFTVAAHGGGSHNSVAFGASGSCGIVSGGT